MKYVRRLRRHDRVFYVFNKLRSYSLLETLIKVLQVEVRVQIIGTNCDSGLGDSVNLKGEYSTVGTIQISMKGTEQINRGLEIKCGYICELNETWEICGVIRNI